MDNVQRLSSCVEYIRRHSNGSGRAPNSIWICRHGDEIVWTKNWVWRLKFINSKLYIKECIIIVPFDGDKGIDTDYMGAAA